MRILVIDEEFPYPTNTGQRARSFNLLSRVARNHEMHYLAYGKEDSENFRVFRQRGMNPIAVDPQVPSKSGLLFYFRLLGNLFSSRPYIVTSHYSEVFQKALNSAVEDKKPDLILCEWTPYAAFVEHIADIKKLIVTQNIETDIWRRYRENERNWIKKVYIAEQARKIGVFEKAAFSWVDGATAVSQVDAEQINAFNPRLPVKVVENGVDLEYFVPSETEPQGKQLVFVGTMDWRPNQDASVFFVDRILPLIKEKHPDIEIFLVGRKPPRHIVQLNSVPGVTVTGSVDDVRPYVHSAAVYVVPLRIGGGTRLKILDALAMKKAVVSTRVGAEGLEVTDGKDILLADSPEQFSEKVDHLLTNPNRAADLGERGRRLVEERYGWDSLAKKLEDFLGKIVGES